MREIILGKSGIAVSAVGLGGIQFSKITRAAVAKVIAAAIDEGITFLETAHGYFDSEKKLGSALRRAPGGADPRQQEFRPRRQDLHRPPRREPPAAEDRHDRRLSAPRR